MVIVGELDVIRHRYNRVDVCIYPYTIHENKLLHVYSYPARVSTT